MDEQLRIFRETILPGLPEDFKRLIQGQELTVEPIGCSGAGVFYLGRAQVLKVAATDEAADGELEMLHWLRGRLPVPRVLASHRGLNETSILMTRLPGRMVCDPAVLADPLLAARLMAQGILRFREIDPAGCPRQVGLDHRLRLARHRVETQAVDMAQAEPDTFSPQGFDSPAAVYDWLVANRPAEEAALVHGDYCLPNVLAEGETLTGFLDLGFCGIGDPWLDIALAVRSLGHNLEETGQGESLPDALALFFKTLGIAPDWTKIRYYQLLDELF